MATIEAKRAAEPLSPMAVRMLRMEKTADCARKTESSAVDEMVILVGTVALCVDLLIVFVNKAFFQGEFPSLVLSAMLVCQASLAGIGLAIVPIRVAPRILYAALIAFFLAFVCALDETYPISGYAGQGIGATVSKAAVLVAVQLLVGFVGVFAGRAAWRGIASGKMQFRLSSLLLAIGVIAVTLAVGRIIFYMLPPGQLALDFGRQLLGTAVYGTCTALVALTFVFWLFPHGWRIKLMTSPLAGLAVGGILFMELIAMHILWGRAQWGSLLISLVVMLTSFQGLCLLLTLMPLRFCSVFGAARPSSQ